MLTTALNELIEKRDLSFDMASEMMTHFMDGTASDVQIAGLLTALSCKGESIQEISACASVMRSRCEGLTNSGDVLEIVGTGGDRASTFNISTLSAICLAGAGVKVAKHGNTSVSSKCGASDVLEALGINIRVSKEKSQQLLDTIGICFLFAPLYHTGMKHVAPVRKQLGVRTIFNILGPLANPAKANIQLLGVYDEKLIEPMANVLKNLGVKRAMVVRGSDGLDEITLTGKTKCCEICANGELKSYEIDPRDYGFTLCQPQDLVGGDANENAEIIKEILGGKAGAKRDIVVLNSAVALYLTSENKTIQECIQIISSVIDTAKGLKKLHEFINESNRV